MVAQHDNTCSKSKVNSATSLHPLVFFAGYSGSGKTTYCIPVLKELGYEVLSSSVLLHEFSERLIADVLGGDKFDSYDRTCVLDFFLNVKSIAKKEESLSNLFLNTTISSRKFLIDLAEKGLVPVFTRGVFAHAIADRIIKSENQKLAIEVFNTEEFSLLSDRLSSLGIKGFAFNLRRIGEDSSVDDRDLLPMASIIRNDGSYEDLRAKLIELLERL
jgi:hypothetical protein